MDYYKYKECIFALSDDIVSVRRALSGLLISKNTYSHKITIKYKYGEEVIIEGLSKDMSELIYNHIYDYLMGAISLSDIIEELREFNKGTLQREVI